MSDGEHIEISEPTLIALFGLEYLHAHPDKTVILPDARDAMALLLMGLVDAGGNITGRGRRALTLARAQGWDYESTGATKT